MGRPAAIGTGALLLASAGCALKGAKLLAGGDSRLLRERPASAPPNAPDRPGILLIALDGVDRALLYDMLQGGEMPAFARLLRADGGSFPHAYFDGSFLSTLPSSTMVAWVTALTGVPPARHGIAGNEFFVRERREMVAPVPVTIDDKTPVLACYTDDYIDAQRLAPSVWERMRTNDPNVLVWVAMQHFHAGADRLLLTDRNVIGKAFEAFIEEQVTKRVSDEDSRVAYEKLDSEVIDVVTDELREGPVPDVLSVYLSGTDSYAHVADKGPDAARREYLREVVDPMLVELADRLNERHALDDRWIVVTSDHGHTEVVHDDAHALSIEGDDEPPALLAKAGFRVRPFELEVPPDADFQAVLAYQGAMAYVYLADRSTCAVPGTACDWSRPPRYREDVLALAEAFHRNDREGHLVPALRGVLDLVLVRRPRPVAEDDLPFEVYVGRGRTQPVAAYLRAHPHPTYVDVPARLHDLAVGPHGERAGDLLLLAHNGDRPTPDGRYYFATLYRSWHGSPSRKDSEIPLIVAHPGFDARTIGSLVHQTLGAKSSQQRLTDVLLALRERRVRPVAATAGGR
jgi:predicted AlkP superfamily pyrophosphatase or phosphodiesterase